MPSAQRWFEETGSRSASVKRLGTNAKSTCTVKYRALGYANDTLVHNEASGFFSANRFYTINNVTYLVQSYELTHLGGDAWEVVATYESQGEDDPSQQEPFKRQRSFDTAGATTHITCALAERRYGDGAPDQKCAINVDDDTVHGVDIVIPALQWQEQYDIANSYVSSGYIRALADLTGRVNDGVFRGFEAGEVLFLGASGSQQWDSEKGDGPWSITYKFSASCNETSLAIGPVTNIEKKGHEYLWVKYGKKVEANGGSGSQLMNVPQYVYVNEVYKKGDFTALGLG